MPINSFVTSSSSVQGASSPKPARSWLGPCQTAHFRQYIGPRTLAAEYIIACLVVAAFQLSLPILGSIALFTDNYRSDFFRENSVRVRDLSRFLFLSSALLREVRPKRSSSPPSGLPSYLDLWILSLLASAYNQR